MTQIFAAFVTVWLLEAHRLWWGIPALILVIAGLVGIFAPTSLRVLSRRE